jgi:subtilisin family serine protease
MASRAKGSTGAKKSTAAASPRGARRGGAKSTDKGDVSKDPVPPKIFAQVSPRSVGGVSMFEGQDQINSTTVFNFFSEGDLVNAAVARLREAGFEILQISPLTINIAGSAATYRKAFSTNIALYDRPVIKEFGKKEIAQFVDSPQTKTPGLIETRGTKFEDLLEGVALEEPVYYMAPSMYAPLKPYWHLRIPGDISLACNADRVHRTGITGKGVKVAMVDSGWFKHPYFVGRGYKAAPVVLGPSAANPLKDESGHGTGESANIFSNAPDIDFMPVKINFVNSTGAFNAAVGLNPDIITCSWGSSVQSGPLSAANQALAAAIAAAVASGITVIFSAGNGHFGFPGQHPDVISAGGVFMNPDETLRASDYASGFMSNIYPNRRVPDLCGLVGMKPKAIYIMLPVEPSDEIDTDLAGGTHPNGDQTTTSDGWAAFSGTSAAAPQLAGVAALIKQACPGLKPADIKDILRKTARDVTTGNCNSSTGGAAATVGPDTATGDGLVDAHKAVLLAKVRCLGPITPPIVPITTPVVPVTPTPITPITGPVRPIVTSPVVPVTPPVTPVTPGPVVPVQPVRPIAPIVNPGPVTPAADEPAGMAGRSEAGAPRLSSQDVEALESMVVSSELDLE